MMIVAIDLHDRRNTARWLCPDHLQDEPVYGDDRRRLGERAFVLISPKASGYISEVSLSAAAVLARRSQGARPCDSHDSDLGNRHARDHPGRGWRRFWLFQQDAQFRWRDRHGRNRNMFHQANSFTQPSSPLTSGCSNRRRAAGLRSCSSISCRTDFPMPRRRCIALSSLSVRRSIRRERSSATPIARHAGRRGYFRHFAVALLTNGTGSHWVAH